MNKPEYTQSIYGDGLSIMKDGISMPVDDLIEELQAQITKERALATIKEIQGGYWDRASPTPPRGEVAVHCWDSDEFSLGMEYGAIVVLMQLFDISASDLAGECAEASG